MHTLKVLLASVFCAGIVTGIVTGLHYMLTTFSWQVSLFLILFFMFFVAVMFDGDNLL